MPRYVALLGSINVGGNRLSMAELREAFEREGLEQVETVIASGNVLFEHEERPVEGLAEMLEWIVNDRFGFHSMVAVLNAAELRHAIEDNPFAADGDEAKVHTLFLDGEVDPAQFRVLVEDHQGRGRERLAIGPRSLYIDYVDGVGTSRLTGAFLERRLGRHGTARNMRSLARILAKLG
ncbi:DUF1697 domain-containing protein [Novosphingobium sp.]|uniref:DUF1697 domain-containing protein n=1 Tax=Novosphingobium sp. TaxID=1874826 RepID=UPI00261F3A7E|nr:DUF1697 domain-containing protein [Novosphingobium sp.]